MLTIIGCGNRNRSDDGVGVVVAQRLEERLALDPMEGVRVIDAGVSGVEVMLEARGSDALVILDACVGATEPGAIHDLPSDALEEVPASPLSSHEFRWNHALAAGRKLFPEGLPSDVTVWLVEAEVLEVGQGLSPAVGSAADILFERALARMLGHAGEGAGAS